jgi:voltage-gated potassium channel
MLFSKENFRSYLDNIDHPIGRNINLIILGLIWLSSLFFISETYPIYPAIKEIIAPIDTAILIIFLMEYLIRFWCAEQKISFIFNIFSLLDLISILPLLIGLIDFDFLRLLRWFRVLRFLRFLKLEISLFGIKNEDTIVITRIVLILFTIIFLYSGLIYQVEHPINPQQFKNFLDAFYFCVVTMTTVGFGDMTPLSEEGKFVTLFMILTGVMVIPWQIGELIKQLIKTTTKVDQICSGCGLLSHEFDAQFCKLCGTKLEKKQ